VKTSEQDGRTEASAVHLLAVVGLWLAYLLAVPVLRARHGPAVLFLAPTVGVYLFTWLSYYRHELWHRYFRSLDNETWFDAVSYLVWSDPQVYRTAHPTHHAHVHTPGDIEFFCVDWATDRRRRTRQFLLELCFGNIAWELATLWRLRRGPGTLRRAAVALALRVALWTGLLGVAAWLLGGRGWHYFVTTSALTIWLGSLMTRHLQWVEHLGVVSAAPLAERNLLARNLPSTTPLAWLFNLVNHDDAREHVLHHTAPHKNSRGLPELTLPPSATTVTIPGYLRILAFHYQDLRGPAAAPAGDAVTPGG
jgi:Fatty acid desaturase